MLINYGMFRKNGGIHSGWCLKPNILQGIEREADIQTKFKINIVSAQHLGVLLPQETPLSEAFVYISITMIDLIKDEENDTYIAGRHSSTVCQYNLFHPSWRDNEYIFTVDHAETSIMVIKAINPKKSTVLGRTAIPCDCIRPGYRVFGLMDEDLDDLPYSRILCHFEIDSILKNEAMKKIA